MNTDAVADEVHTVPRLRRVLAWVAFTLIAATVAYFTWPTSLGGCTTLTIVSGHSMEPTYYTNDIVISRCGSPDVGDVAVYATHDTGGARIVHRVIGGDGWNGWQLQGDNNDFVDQFRPTDDDVLGTAVLHIPRVGLVAKAMSSPIVWLSLFVLAAALFVWPSRVDGEEPTDEPEPLVSDPVPEPRVVDDFRMEDLDDYIAARAAEPLTDDDPTEVFERDPFDLDWLLEGFDASAPSSPLASDDWWTDEIEQLVYGDRAKAPT